MKTLVCFGDSITGDEYFYDGTARLTPRLRLALPGWRVVNSGVPGDNTYDALRRLNQDVLRYAPDLVTVLLGANDAAFQKMIPLAEYESNLFSIVRAIGPERVLLLSPAPVDEAKPRNRTNVVMAQYAAAAEQAAARAGCRFLPLYDRMFARPGYTRMLEDGVHFEPAGYEFLAGLVLEALHTDWGDITHE